MIHVKAGSPKRSDAVPSAFAKPRKDRPRTLLVSVINEAMWLLDKVYELYEAGQVSHHGTYSLERFCAFHQFAQSTSRTRVLVICVTTIFPSLVVVLLIDSIPLKDPSAGWKANWQLWIRLTCSSFALSFAVVQLLYLTAPDAALTTSKCFSIAFCTALMYVGSMLVTVQWLGFPIPFMFFLTAIVWDTFFLFCSALVIGVTNIKQNAQLLFQLRRFGNIMIALLPLVFIYPAFNALYVRLEGLAQTSLIFVLPPIQFLLKYLVARVAIELEDYIPTLVISIDLFNAIYQSKCLQSSGSMLTTGGVMTIDIVKNIISLRNLYRHVQIINELQQQHNLEQRMPAPNLKRVSGVMANRRGSDRHLLASALETCEHPEWLDPSYFVSLQLRSCSPRGLSRLSQQKTRLLKSMTKRQVAIKQSSTASLSSIAPLTAAGSRNAIVPWPSVPVPVVLPISDHRALYKEKRDAMILGQQEPDERKTLLLKRTLELLRRTEILMLVEYIECAIPVLYATYLSTIFYLPNRKYYPEIEHLTADKLSAMVVRVLIYACLELTTLLWVHFMLHRRFQFSAMHQLAFALEQERLVVQSSFIAWTLVILQFTMVHFGVDFTFKFAWLQHKQ